MFGTYDTIQCGDDEIKVELLYDAESYQQEGQSMFECGIYKAIPITDNIFIHKRVHAGQYNDQFQRTIEQHYLQDH